MLAFVSKFFKLLIMMRTPTRKDFNIDGNTQLREWLQETLDDIKSCKQKSTLKVH